MKGLKGVFAGVTGLLITSILLINFLSSNQRQDNSREQAYRENVAYLRNHLKDLDPASPAAQSIFQTLSKLRGKEFTVRQLVENPESFLTAIREIKTGINGEVYAANYKILELEKAHSLLNTSGIRIQALAWNPADS
jgi:hypothetical protein